MKRALLIIDVQNDYFPKGKYELYQPETALNAMKDLLIYFRQNKLPIYFIQHVSQKGAGFFEKDTDGVMLHKNIEPLKSEEVIVKHYPNCFYETSLQKELEKLDIKELVVCGMMTHMCVDTTVRAANDLGYHVTLISNACATKELQWNDLKIPAAYVQAVYMASLHHKFATVTTSVDYLEV